MPKLKKIILNYIKNYINYIIRCYLYRLRESVVNGLAHYMGHPVYYNNCLPNIKIDILHKF